MRQIVFAGLLSFLILFGFVNNSQAEMMDDFLWGSVLETYVDDNGRVNYAALKKNRKDLDMFIRHIQDINVESLSLEERKAFWINAYNALTLQIVAKKYPVSSIRHIDFGMVWKIKRRVARGKYSLEYIEHEILRPMGDPRIHFAINCASISCPNLPREPFYPDQIEEQLEKAVKDFINNPQKVRLERTGNALRYSVIFDRFREDFLKVAPDIRSYIKKYMNKRDRSYMATHRIMMIKLEYDWGLNEQ